MQIMKKKDVFDNSSDFTLKNQDFIFKPKVSNYKASKFYPVDFVRFNDRPLSVIGATENIITFEEITITLETPNEYISTSFDVYGFDGTKKMTKTVESNHVLYNNSIEGVISTVLYLKSSLPVWILDKSSKSSISPGII